MCCHSIRNAFVRSEITCGKCKCILRVSLVTYQRTKEHISHLSNGDFWNWGLSFMYSVLNFKVFETRWRTVYKWEMLSRSRQNVPSAECAAQIKEANPTSIWYSAKISNGQAIICIQFYWHDYRGETFHYKDILIYAQHVFVCVWSWKSPHNLQLTNLQSDNITAGLY